MRRTQQGMLSVSPSADAGDGILKLGQSRLAFGKFVEFAQGDPALVLAAIAAQDRRNQIADHRHRQNRDGQTVQQHSDFGEQIAARHWFDC